MTNIQIPLAKNGKTTLAIKGTKNVEDIDINVNVSEVKLNVAQLNDAYLYNGTNWVNVNTGETS